MNPIDEQATSEWWRSLYDDTLADLLLERVSAEEALAAARALTATLGVAPGERVFDQCSGVGTYAVPLATLGLRVVGCDLAPTYAERARARARAAGVEIEVHTGDAFTFVPDEPCDAALNLGTSFGYSDDARNIEMLRRAFEALRPGGRFALDFMNVPGVLRGFRAEMVDRLQTPEGEVRLERHTDWDLAAGTMLKRWTWFAPHAAPVTRETRVRAYAPWELVALVEEAGFVALALHGSLLGEPLTLDSPRCVVIARRPA